MVERELGFSHLVDGFATPVSNIVMRYERTYWDIIISILTIRIKYNTAHNIPTRRATTSLFYLPRTGCTSISETMWRSRRLTHRFTTRATVMWRTTSVPDVPDVRTSSRCREARIPSDHLDESRTCRFTRNNLSYQLPPPRALPSDSTQRASGGFSYRSTTSLAIPRQ